MLMVCYIASRDNLLEELLREPDEVATKRKRTRDTLKVLEQAFRVSNLYFRVRMLFSEVIAEYHGS